MIKIKRIHVIGRDVNVEPADGDLWFYKAINTKTNKYLEVVTEYPSSKELHQETIRTIKDKLK